MQIILRTEARTHGHTAIRALMPMSGRGQSAQLDAALERDPPITGRLQTAC